MSRYAEGVMLKKYEYTEGRKARKSLRMQCVMHSASPKSRLRQNRSLNAAESPAKMRVRKVLPLSASLPTNGGASQLPCPSVERR